jgi:hypothetical protein
MPCVVVTGVAALLFAITIERELSALSSPYSRGGDGFIVYCFSIPITAFGVMLPALAVAWLFRSGAFRLQRLRRLVSFKAFLSELNRDDNFVPTLLLFFWALLFPVYLLVENFMPLSIEPLTTPLCAVLFMPAGYLLLKQWGVAKRLTILAVLSSLILATSYVDWNPRKSMLHDLYRVRAGMTADDVKRTMTGHITGEHGDLENDGYFLFISGRGAAYGADIATVRLIDGKVSSVDFSHD